MTPIMNSSDTTSWPSQGVSSIVARVGPSNFDASNAMQENSRGNQQLDRRIAVAPMMDWTDRHCRYFLRGFSPDVLLYTEMITAAAVGRGGGGRLLAFHPEEHPVALQLGGSEARELAAAGRAGGEGGGGE